MHYRLRLISCLLFCFLEGCAPGSIPEKNSVAAQSNFESKRFESVSGKAIRDIVVRIDERFKNRTNEMQFALQLMEFVHIHTRIKESSPTFGSLSPVANLTHILFDPEYGHVCGGMSTTLVDVYRAFGIKSRLIQMFSSTPENHVAVEFFFNSKWIAVDPTFSAVFVDENDRFLSYQEVFYRKNKLAIDPHWKYPLSTKFSIEDYAFPYRDLLVKMRALPPYYRDTPDLNFHLEEEEIY